MHIRQSHINERGKNSVKVLINEMYCKYTKTNININLLQLNKAWAAIKAYLNHVHIFNSSLFSQGTDLKQY